MISDLFNIMEELEVSSNIQCHLIHDSKDCKDMLIGHLSTLKVLTVNIRSIFCNYDSLLVFISSIGIDIDIIVLVECWTQGKTILPNIANYTTHRTNKTLNKSYGKVIYIKDSISATVPNGTRN